MKVSTDEAAVTELLTRSVDSVYPSKEALSELLASGKQITVYVGIDPTADYVHLGHSTNYLILERLHKLGHKIIVLVGDFTAMIGDPTDKTSARVQLSREEIERNLATFKEQIGKILNFNDQDNPIEFRFNSEWLKELNFEQLIDLASNFTVQHMLERDMFERRLAENKPLFVHEFFYPLMQGYDSVALGVDLEIGGTDQTFNMLAGRTLAKRYLGREKYVLTTTLLTNPKTGEKLMSKSLGTGVGLNENPTDMFGKIMSLADEGIIQTFIDCTRLPLSDIAMKRERLEAGDNPKDLKLELAHEIVSMYHGSAAGDEAQKDWVTKFSTREIPEDVTVVSCASGDILLSVLVERGLIESKTQARRLFESGAVRDMERDEKIDDPAFVVLAPLTLKVGKKVFVKVVPS